uniref:Peptidase M15 n=1 Tax=uncultured marine virus TaxID=186617 RepID=A0A0F7L953_9VIRU|nr:peptidase M15 [uncultured marine virus]
MAIGPRSFLMPWSLSRKSGEIRMAPQCRQAISAGEKFSHCQSILRTREWCS